MTVSTVLAVACASAVILILLAPLLLANARPRLGAAVAGFYAVVLAGLGGSYSGLLATSDISPALIEESTQPEITASQCTEIFRLLDQANAILDRRTPPVLIVSRKAWAALPESAQDAVTECVERSWPEGSPEAQVEER